MRWLYKSVSVVVGRRRTEGSQSVEVKNVKRKDMKRGVLVEFPRSNAGCCGMPAPVRASGRKDG
jgi:hypothetical protein